MTKDDCSEPGGSVCVEQKYAIQLILNEYEAAALFSQTTETQLRRIYRGRYASVDDLMRDHLGRAIATADFAARLGLISVEEGVSFLTSFLRDHPEFSRLK